MVKHPPIFCGKSRYTFVDAEGFRWQGTHGRLLIVPQQLIGLAMPKGRGLTEGCHVDLTKGENGPNVQEVLVKVRISGLFHPNFCTIYK